MKMSKLTNPLKDILDVCCSIYFKEFANCQWAKKRRHHTNTFYTITHRDTRKTAILNIINNELLSLEVDITALQETRLAGKGSIREKEFAFFWYGKFVDERRDYGVGFAVNNTPLQYMEVGSDGNKRITTLRLHTKKGTATLHNIYAHTLYTDEQVKYLFYEKLNHIVCKLAKHYQFVNLGDFNARVRTNHDF